MSCRGWWRCVTKSCRHFLVIETYVEDVRQDAKHGPDLLETIMRPTFRVKAKLLPILYKLKQFGSKIANIKVSTFWW